MKRTVIILSALAAIVVGGLIAVAYWLSDKTEADKNKDRTAAARAARWPEEDLTEQQNTTENETSKTA